MTQARDYMINLYLDWLNNYLTVEKFAEHNGLTTEEGLAIIALGKAIYSHAHPET